MGKEKEEEERETTTVTDLSRWSGGGFGRNKN